MIKPFRDHPKGQAYYAELATAMGFPKSAEPEEASIDPSLTPEQLTALRKARAAEFAFVNETPVKKLPAFSSGAFTEARLDEIIRALNTD